MFDVAKQVLVVEVDAGVERARWNVVFGDEESQARAACLAGTGAETLICGAISWPLELAITALGVEVIAQTCGEVEQVLSAFLEGRLRQDGFLMPGCRGRKRFRTRQGHGVS